MLEFKRDNGDYLIIEHMFGFTKTFIKTVRYKADLSMMKVNDDPWRPVTPSARNWFEKYYLEAKWEE